MPGNIYVPSLVRKVDSNLRSIVVDNWARRSANTWWKRVAMTKPASTKTEYIQWLLQTAKIAPMGNGGDQQFSDIMAQNWSVSVDDYGAALQLTVDEIDDALGAQANTGNALDYAASWAKQIGNYAAYWPQLQTANALKGGKSLPCYDGGNFFRTGHPINPYDASAGTFDNLMTGRPFNAANFAYISSYIESIPGPDGLPRHLKPKKVASGTGLRLSVTQTLGAEFFTDPLNSGGASPATNMVKGLYDIEPPIIAADLNESTDVWYIFCELMEDADLAPVVYYERAAFQLNSYSPYNDQALSQMDAFSWRMKGRNALTFGHPYLAFRVEPTGSQWTKP
jgi:phage major head subunit gpT-like protein